MRRRAQRGAFGRAHAAAWQRRLAIRSACADVRTRVLQRREGPKLVNFSPQGRYAESGERRAESGERRAESGERRAESGERRAESGERRAESGERESGRAGERESGRAGERESGRALRPFCAERTAPATWPLKLRCTRYIVFLLSLSRKRATANDRPSSLVRRFRHDVLRAAPKGQRAVPRIIDVPAAMSMVWARKTSRWSP